MTMRRMVEAGVRKWSEPRKAVHKAGHGGPRLTFTVRGVGGASSLEKVEGMFTWEDEGKDLSIPMDWCWEKMLVEARDGKQGQEKR